MVDGGGLERPEQSSRGGTLPRTDSGRPELRLARSMAAMTQSGLREVMGLTSRPQLLSLAIGLPAAKLFPAAALAEETARLLTADPGSLQYGVPYHPLKTQIVELMAMRGVRCNERQVFLTSGAQQGMDLLTRLLLDPGGQVVLEWAVYDGIQMAIKLRDPQILTVSTDAATGIDVDEIESLMLAGARPAFLYVVPEGHNPQGVSISREKRLRLARLARRFGLPILEDDAYGFLYYDDDPAPPLRALEEEWVFYIGSFSKILAPSLRAGWLVVPEALTAHLSALKHSTDLDTPSIGHRMISVYLAAGHFPGHLATLRAEYRSRRDTMLAALAAHFPPEVTWSYPSSGMFVWVQLPPGMDATTLLRVAIERENVAFTPGSAFCTGGQGRGRHCLRLSFTSCSAGDIEHAVERLGRLLCELQASGRPPV
jgi:2-aminoadipate transaminase